MNKKEAVLELSPDEKQKIQNLRKNEEKMKTCSDEIIAILQKYNANLTINPKSPFGNPEILISIK